MIKAIVFDFDGVILESADIKTEAFAELFSEYPEHRKKIVDYHIENGGISRFVKFRHIYKNILVKKLTEEKEENLGKRFSDIVLAKVLNAPFVPGIKAFLDKCGYEFFIASGTPQDELMRIIKKRGLEKYFKEIMGTPAEKKDIIRSIMDKYRLRKYEVAYVGDALSDYKAALSEGVHFVARLKNDEELLNGLNCVKIKDFVGFDHIIRSMDNEGGKK